MTSKLLPKSHKFGENFTKRNFVATNARKNLDNLRMQIAKVNNPIIETTVQETIKSVDELIQYYDDMKREEIVCNNIVDEDCLTDVIKQIGVIELNEPGVYVVTGQICIKTKKSGMLKYFQSGVSINLANIDTTRYVSDVVNIQSEIDYNHIDNLACTITITEACNIYLWAKIGYFSGKYEVSSNSCRFSAVQL